SYWRSLGAGPIILAPSPVASKVHTLLFPDTLCLLDALQSHRLCCSRRKRCPARRLAACYPPDRQESPDCSSCSRQACMTRSGPTGRALRILRLLASLPPKCLGGCPFSCALLGWDSAWCSGPCFWGCSSGCWCDGSPSTTR